ncbi:MAG: methylenetetrahydrofolate--tRNA-(uracil(54)-C(5))-methyltransferase (FADH(2)-oxidizing) TrmFO [Oscillospiraceae bacterium]|jgi:methylenetetrahydrofolate--tRNA-(uracil-5-)-methyltransferase|nr:methylenetetrahydrofolate--tRNA-(uracil(54)-C(5))-methyltransferase (FADH(2)-oxidizing) TrmFO [Oscillospiraceae bacterium]
MIHNNTRDEKSEGSPNLSAAVIGGGFAGVEAAWQLARHGVAVTLCEMKPGRRSPAHALETLAEPVCSNSFKALRVESAAGLLKEEMARLGSLCVPCAKECAVPAGGALAVDRERFSALVTQKIAAEPLIDLRREEIFTIPKSGTVIVAAGPLCSDALAEDIRDLCGGGLSFYDAAAPIITAESLDMEHCFAASRYDRGEADDYINCPLNKDEYEIFHAALLTAERAQTHDFDVYEGCMPVEVLAARGTDAIRFGPMKPVGLRDPRTGRRPWAVLQLRKENAGGTLLNLVGFQTNLKFGEQRRVFGLIPALRGAEFVRYGVMHRNSYIDSPRLLNADYSFRARGDLFFAGQITGVEGYMESAGSGLLAGINAARRLLGESAFVPPRETMLGALAHYISDESVHNFQPMGANFGILPPLDTQIRGKRERYTALAERSLTKYGKNILP